VFPTQRSLENWDMKLASKLALYGQIKSEVEFSNYISAVELTCISIVYREL